MLEEGRERVAELRQSQSSPPSLVTALQRVARQLGQENPEICFTLTTEGQRPRLQTLAREELYALAREALTNAFRHTGVGNVCLTVRCDRQRLTLTVSDNGPGIAPEILAAGARYLHWGLPGMRERAQRIGARLSLECPAQQGTVLRVCVPAHRAYLRHRPWPAWLWRHCPRWR